MSGKRHTLVALVLLLLASLLPVISRPETLSGASPAVSTRQATGTEAPSSSGRVTPSDPTASPSGVPAAPPVSPAQHSETPAPAGPLPSRPEARGHLYAPSLLGAYRKTMELESEIRPACDRYGVPLPLARAVCMYESGGDEGLISGAGAHGYFQVMPATYRLMGVSTNIEAGVKYLSQLLHRYKREDDALAAYNGGPHRFNSRRALPIETLQYVVGVGIYRTLLTREEPEIRAEASKLKLHPVRPSEDWVAISMATGIPVLELRLYNPYLALRRLRQGERLAHPISSTGPFLYPLPDSSRPYYLTRRGDNYLHLAFSLDIDLDQFRQDNTLWRVQVPLEGMRLVVRTRADPRPTESPAFAAPPTAASAEAAASAGAAAPAEASASEAAHPGPAVARAIVHRVRRGETLVRIASRYGVSVEAILLANRLRRTHVTTGQVLKIPVD